MKARHLPYLLILVGAVAVGMAVREWQHFYGPIADDLRVSVTGAWRCLYLTPQACPFGRGIDHFHEYRIYHPWPLWLGAALIGTGIVIRLVLALAPFGGAKQGRR